VVPFFHDQIRQGGPVTVTTTDMTRFLLSLDSAVDTIFAAIRTGFPGDIYVPRAPSARVVDIAAALIGKRPIEQVITGIRPGEKIHESLVSDEEAGRTIKRGNWYAIQPMLSEVSGNRDLQNCLTREYSSGDNVMTPEETAALLSSNDLLLPENGFEVHLRMPQVMQLQSELLR
jgi:UDP-glucose 4-epimerase